MTEEQIQKVGEAHGMPQHVIDKVKDEDQDKATISVNGGKEHDMNTEEGKAGFEEDLKESIKDMSDALIKKEADRVEDEKAAKPELPLEGETQDVGGVAGDRLRAFIERVERLEEEKSALMEDIKEVYGEAKAIGFDVKTLRKIVSLRKMETEKRREEEELLELYKSAIGMH